MSKGKFEYVKNFEDDEKCLPNSWIVVRINGRNFQRFSELHGYEKPIDKRAIELMTRAASTVMEELKEVTLAFGASDEYSFVFRKDAQLFNRRHDKILSVVNSIFSTAFVYYWNNYFGFTKMLYPPSFDARIVLYPTDKNLRDYLSWRQADVHFNNIYNTTFWALVLKKKYSFQQAEERIRNTSVSQKNEILFSELDINYNNEPPLFRKGTTLIRKFVTLPPEGKLKQFIFPITVDIIGEAFWKENPEIIGMKSIQIYNKKEGEHGFMVPCKPPYPITDEPVEPLNPMLPNIPPAVGIVMDRPMKIIKPNSGPDRQNRPIIDQRNIINRRDNMMLDRRDAPMLDYRDVPMLDQRDVLMHDHIDNPLVEHRDMRMIDRRENMFQRRNTFFVDRSNQPLKPRDQPAFIRRGSGPTTYLK